MANRLSMATNHPAFSGTLAVAGGREGTAWGGGQPGSEGSVVVLTLLPPTGTVIMIR